MLRSLLKLGVLGLLSVQLFSCAPAKSFYVLTPEGPAPSGGGMSLGVGPVSLASYLDRANLVFQESGNRMGVAESHRWAGDLEENIARVTATNLGRRLGTGNVRTYPWGSDSDLRYQVSLDIRQLHGTADGEAVLEAAWRVYSLPDRRMVTSKSWSGSEPLKADGYDEVAAAQSRLLARLATEIAATLR
ncbi:PqiC family protein [Luteolibacter arcticus]|uniref:PqiC family protein n=1 Tax=Luteolibacter arcticus TaxID=1581411 RepID=A0ABT3GC25_9BACT|nr:PqiC family protein [Luteolibacter arcticus]MCW1921180.1 PqiC family protein [Luteolibacter arcticus]